MVQLARAAHPEALFTAMFIMFVGVALAAVSIEGMLVPTTKDRGLTERKGTRLENGGLGENLAGVQSPRPLP